MIIIDSQVHAYEANTPKRPWHSVPNWPDHVTGDEMVAAMDKVGVDGAIFISAFSMYRYDASYATEVQRAHPGRLAIVKPVCACTGSDSFACLPMVFDQARPQLGRNGRPCRPRLNVQKRPRPDINPSPAGPVPGDSLPVLFSARVSTLQGPSGGGELRPVAFFSIRLALVLTAEHTFGEALLLLLVEGCVERLGGIGEFLLVVGPLDLRISVLAHFVEYVELALLLGACVTYRNPAIGLLFTHVLHGACKSRPVFLLVCGQVQVNL
jgi:hypothetical protein